MCWNEPVSWTTLLLGAATCLFARVRFREMQLDAQYSKLTWYWQFCLLMQLAEALVHRFKATAHERACVELALWINVAQPVIGAALFVPEMQRDRRALCATVLGAYVVYVARNASRFDRRVFRKGCPNLKLAWWEDAPATLLYFAASFVFQGCIQHADVRLLSLSIFVGSFVVTHLVYPCSYGGIWCWSVVLAPLIACAVV